MNSQLPGREGLEGVEARVDDRFDENVTEECQIFRALCRAAEPRSVVGFAPGTDRFGVFVGLLGELRGANPCSSRLAQFPKGWRPSDGARD
jgi:hypothetical protein